MDLRAQTGFPGARSTPGVTHARDRLRPAGAAYGVAAAHGLVDPETAGSECVAARAATEGGDPLAGGRQLESQTPAQSHERPDRVRASQRAGRIQTADCGAGGGGG